MVYTLTTCAPARRVRRPSPRQNKYSEKTTVQYYTAGKPIGPILLVEHQADEKCNRPSNTRTQSTTSPTCQERLLWQEASSSNSYNAGDEASCPPADKTQQNLPLQTLRAQYNNASMETTRERDGVTTPSVRTPSTTAWSLRIDKNKFHEILSDVLTYEQSFETNTAHTRRARKQPELLPEYRAWQSTLV